MKQRKSFRLRIPLLAGMLTLLWLGQGYCLTAEEIFQWTARQMEIDHQLEMPPIHYVDGSELKQVFLDNNQKAYLRWESEYGQERARKILQLYLDEIIGLFDINTGSIFIGSFLSPCRRQAILAHEMTHYFQNKVRGASPVGFEDADTMHFVREMEAYKIEKRFTQTFCSDDNLQAAGYQSQDASASRGSTKFKVKSLK